MRIRHIHLDETDSTNTYIKGVPLEPDEMVVVSTAWQTAGRGQGTNSWESLPGRNLLFSLMARPMFVPVTQQFVLSMAGALAIKDVLNRFTPHISIKWPNDIYWRDRKISGTLIETSLAAGAISRFVYGIGLNVNQQAFTSDAPNPVSLIQITGKETPLEQLLNSIVESFLAQWALLEAGQSAQIVECYNAALYRATGFHCYSDRQGAFEAETIGVDINGIITLRDRLGQLRTYSQPHATCGETANKLRFEI